MNLLPIGAGLIGMAVVFLAIPIILGYCRRMDGAEDCRELHHTHSSPVPRLGGVGLAAAFLLLELCMQFLFPDKSASRERLVLAMTSLAMFGLGFWDDLLPLGARRKLFGQILIACVVCCFGIGITDFKVPVSGQIITLGSW